MFEACPASCILTAKLCHPHFKCYLASKYYPKQLGPSLPVHSLSSSPWTGKGPGRTGIHKTQLLASRSFCPCGGISTPDGHELLRIYPERSFLCFSFYSGGRPRRACRILVPGPGSSPHCPHWKHRVLTTGGFLRRVRF